MVEAVFCVLGLYHLNRRITRQSTQDIYPGCRWTHAGGRFLVQYCVQGLDAEAIKDSFQVLRIADEDFFFDFGAVEKNQFKPTLLFDMLNHAVF